jgi:hypothetical protein
MQSSGCSTDKQGGDEDEKALRLVVLWTAWTTDGEWTLEMEEKSLVSHSGFAFLQDGNEAQ